MKQSAQPARFDRIASHRRGLIAKVHIAKVQLGLSDDDYRSIILRETGHLSAKDCTDRQLEDALAAFAAQGFTTKAKTPQARSGPKPADHPMARKARAMWISLHQLGAIDNPTEQALEAFARRQLGCDRLQWANQTLAYKLVEALKAIADRHGWDQSTEGVQPGVKSLVLKRRLVAAIAAKLVAADIVPTDWRIARVARELTGIEIVNELLATMGELDRIAAALGAKLRAATGERA
jgi:phage gp16-like protein